MVDSVNIPKDLTKIFEIEVKDVSGPLKRFLTDLLIRVENLEKANTELTQKIEAITNGN